MKALWGLLSWIVVLGACGRSTPQTPARGPSGIAEIAANRFPHGAHTGAAPAIRNYRGRGLGCGDCHDAEAVRAGKQARPGFDQHAPCDDCHRDAFFAPPGKFCQICHTRVDITGARVAGGPSPAPLQPFPDRGMQQVLASAFSHAQHLDAAAMDRAAGFHVSCADCHQAAAGATEPQLPQHAQCARCHDAIAGIKERAPMSACTQCHTARDLELTRGRKFIIGDLRFSHQRHQRDAAGATVACATCHQDVRSSDHREQLAVPAMERCATCHEDTSRSPGRVRMKECSVCHAQIATGTPPTNHGVTGAIPIDHTLQFRKDHGKAAASANGNCRFCHTQVQGAPEDSCMQCHAVMRPRDHSLAFRDDHGRAAQADNERCASCHTPDSCAACHAVPPRSHVPLSDFKYGGHAQAARFNLTSCMSCHTYETTCAACHREQR